MAKLTLSMNSRVIDNAKHYAKRRHTSVSQMVEAYLAAVTEPPASAVPKGPILHSLRGSLTRSDREIYRKHLVEKYR